MLQTEIIVDSTTLANSQVLDILKSIYSLQYFQFKIFLALLVFISVYIVLRFILPPFWHKEKI